MNIPINNLEAAWKADETDRVSNAIRAMFTRDLLSNRLEEANRLLSEAYPRLTKKMTREKKKVSLMKLIKSCLP